ncbi:HD domain-containing protein [Neptunicella marina]|uniref:HD domain-containing protein n=1 Tax=Neptunicella marina TaxID=2125989 RepID=A0A8J6M077_9ALTE|nr:HD domain-containing protein [Neptunicella marina]MBC3767004.1 HD domain-containing protein [Neptunicella marina]
MQDFKQQLDFIMELDQLKRVYRKALIKCDNNRFENSAEHSWHIALMAQVLSVYAEEKIDLSRVITMLLLHDIVEIDAGDTFAFGEHADLAEQNQKEVAAAKRIFGLLPATQSQQFLDLWLEFEDAETADARFAKSMDRVLPLLQNMQNNGGSWSQHQVRKKQVLKRNLHLQTAAPKLWKFVCEQIDIATERGWLIDA